MRNGTVWVALICWVSIATGWAQQGGKAARPETLVRWHFAGTDQLARLKNQKQLQAVLALPETAALRETALTAIASQAAGRFNGQPGGPANPETAGRIKEMLADVLRFETKFLMAGAPGGDADWALGIRLPQDREALWRRQLNDLARGAGLQVKEGEKWSASHDKYHLSLVNEGKWLLLRGGYSDAEPKAFADFRKGIEKSGGKQVLTAELNFPQLGEVWKAPRLSHAPRMVLNATPNGDGIRSEVELEYSRDLGIKPEKWNVPTTIFREPLVGFTAIQGVREGLQGSPAIQKLGATKTPNQLFAWSVGDTPFSTYVAGDVGNPKDVIRNLADRLTQVIQQRQGQGPMMMGGQAQVSSNGMSVAWRGLPVAVPFAQVAAAPASSFLVAGLFPVATAKESGGSLPKELLEELNKRNQIYYEWEITDGRLTQWRPIWQLAHILTSQRIPVQSASDRFLMAAAPNLGNTVTQATLAGDRKIKVVRQSHIGFNALELVLLAHRLDPQDLRAAGEPRQPGQNEQRPQRPSPPQRLRDAETGR